MYSPSTSVPVHGEELPMLGVTLSLHFTRMSVSSQKHQKFKVSGDTSEQILGGIFTGLGNLNAELGACGFVSLNLSLLHFRYFTNIPLLFISSVNFCCLEKLKSICLHLLAL